jgi:hypothetical protein
MIEIFHKGTLLSKAQVDVLMAQPAEMTQLSPRNFRKAVDIALKNAGVPVPDIEVGQVVTWSIRLQLDRGRVISYDERADKYRVTSKLRKRDVTVCGRDIRVFVKEAEHEAAE